MVVAQKDYEVALNAVKPTLLKEINIDELIGNIVINITELEGLILNPDLDKIKKVALDNSQSKAKKPRIKKIKKEKSAEIQLKTEPSEDGSEENEKSAKKKKKRDKKEAKKRKRDEDSSEDEIIAEEVLEYDELSTSAHSKYWNLKVFTKEEDLKLLKIFGASGWHKFIREDQIYQKLVKSHEFPGRTDRSLKQRMTRTIAKNLFMYNLSDKEREKYNSNSPEPRGKHRVNLEPPPLNLDYTNYEL